MTLDPFQKLLNNLNHELDERNLQSLIHVCGNYIPGAQRERIFSGWDVFSILRQQDLIGSEPEKIANLLAIVKELRPKRRDLVVKVKQHIQEYYEDPETILKDFDSSWDSNRIHFPVSRSGCSTPIPEEDCCRIRCCGFACNYYHDNLCCKACCNTCCNSCGFILGVLFLLLAIVATLSWYSNIPVVTKYLQSNDDIKNAGPFVIGGLIFLAVCSFVCGICIKCFKRRNDDEMPLVYPYQVRYAASDSTRTSNSYPSATPRRIYRSRSCSSGQYTASSSPASRCFRASSRVPRLLGEADFVPDGLQQDEIFTQDLDLEEDDKMEEV